MKVAVILSLIGLAISVLPNANAVLLTVGLSALLLGAIVGLIYVLKAKPKPKFEGSPVLLMILQVLADAIYILRLSNTTLFDISVLVAFVSLGSSFGILRLSLGPKENA